jgi:hypothetical protein
MSPRMRSYGMVFTFALALYAVSAGVTLVRNSLAPHYVYLAYSILHGQLYLDPLPPTTYDLLLYQNHWYVASSPMPALLLMPVVALRGLATSDILFGVVIGAANVVLVYDLIGQLGVHSGTSLPLDEVTRRWLTALFAAGTVHWYVSVLGSVWFNAHVVTVMCLLLYVREVLTRGRSWLAGGWLGLAGLARPTAVFAAAFFVTLAATQVHDWRQFLRRLGPFLFALGVGIGMLLAYNAARFGYALDFGYAYVEGAPNITGTYMRYGGFNLRYLPCNLYVSLAGLPDILGHFSPIAARLCDYLLPSGPLPVANRWLAPNALGISVFLTTPALLYLFYARRRRPLVLAAWIGLLSVALPLWMYHNTGSLQFGYRYSLDAAPFWMMLIADGMRERWGWWARALIILSILINLAGMTWMFRAFSGFGWFSMWRSLLELPH